MSRLAVFQCCIFSFTLLITPSVKSINNAKHLNTLLYNSLTSYIISPARFPCILYSNQVYLHKNIFMTVSIIYLKRCLSNIKQKSYSGPVSNFRCNPPNSTAFLECTTNATHISGESVLEAQGTTFPIYMDILLLFAFIFVLRYVGYLVLRYLRRPGKKQIER